MSRLVALLFFCGGGVLAPWCVAAPATAARVARPEPEAWSPPVASAVVEPFREPRNAYGPGHRGVDYAPAPGTPVRAAGDGMVVFAGEVAGTLHVVVAHSGGRRTSYSFLLRVDVRVGEAVRRGAELGTSGGPAADHAPGWLHFGLRVGERYVDPLGLFSPPDLARLVHLAPVGEALPAWDAARPVGEGRDLGRALGLSARVPSWATTPDTGGASRVSGALDALSGAGGWLVGRAGSGLDGLLAAGATATRFAGRGAAELGRLTRWLSERSVFAPALHDALASARRLTRWLASRGHCTADPPRLDGTGGSGHLLMAVAGIASSTDPTSGATFDLPTRKLGYRSDEVRWFSYAVNGGPYTEPDSVGDLHGAAVRLGEQLEAFARDHPGREVDLIAHSQGGVVVDEFVRHVYKANDRGYPPLGTVVTLSSPHRGAPLASAATRISASRSGAGVLREGASRVSAPPPDAPGVRELAEGSEFLRDVWRGSPPDHFDITSIGAPDDVVVPATQIGAPGAAEVLIDPQGVGDEHHAVTTDEHALAAVRLALEGRPPPCTSWLTGLRGAIEPVVITRVEHELGSVGARAGRIVDAMARAAR